MHWIYIIIVGACAENNTHNRHGYLDEHAQRALADADGAWHAGHMQASFAVLQWHAQSYCTYYVMIMNHSGRTMCMMEGTVLMKRERFLARA